MKTAMSLIMVMLLLGAISCKQNELNNPTANMERGLPDETSLNVRLNEYRDDRLEYIIEAGRMERYTDRRMLYGYQVTLTSYDREGKLSSVVKADTTIVDDARNIIFAHGNAVFESPQGSIKTSKMVWERSIDEITAPGYVVLTRGSDVLRGTGLRTNSKFSFAEMNAVSAEGVINEKDFSW